MIKEADKRDCVVTIFQHLNDANTYQKIYEKCDNRVMKRTSELTNKYESLLTKAEKLYLTNISLSTSNFYGLPKVHKSKQINEAIQQQNNHNIKIHEADGLTVRPIVGGLNWPTRPVTLFKMGIFGTTY